MLQRFTTHIVKQHLFSSEQEVLLAVSGGRDSVVMMHLMLQAGFRFAVAHCNFHLRPNECDRDQAFVQQLAKSKGVPFFTTHFDTLTYALEHGMSIEEAARHLRYDWFASLCASYGYHTLLTAHHSDDSIETFFLNLVRGTGISGLHGIRPVAVINTAHGELRVARPMLVFSRSEITAYAHEHSLAFVDDSTNFETEARRNWIRLQLLPMLSAEYPAFRKTMLSNMEHLHGAEQLFHQQIDLYRQQYMATVVSRVPGAEVCYTSVRLQALSALAEASTILFELLRPYGFTPHVVDEMLSTQPRLGSLFLSPTFEATIHRDMLYIGPRNVAWQPPRLSMHELPIEGFDVASLRSISHSIAVDADAVHLPLRCVQWHVGDRFCPFGMRQTRLVSDFLKDIRLHRLERSRVSLLVDADDRVVWVVGLRADNRFRLTSQSRRVLLIGVDNQ